MNTSPLPPQAILMQMIFGQANLRITIYGLRFVEDVEGQYPVRPIYELRFTVYDLLRMWKAEYPVRPIYRKLKACKATEFINKFLQG